MVTCPVASDMIPATLTAETVVITSAPSIAAATSITEGELLGVTPSMKTTPMPAAHEISIWPTLNTVLTHPRRLVRAPERVTRAMTDRLCHGCSMASSGT